MTVAIIVIGDSYLLESAFDWAQAGLVADSIWVSADDVAEHLHPDRPNSLQGRMVTASQVGEKTALFQSISSLGRLDDARVAWVRSTDASVPAEMKTLEQLLRDMLPPDDTHWLDIVIPTSRTDSTIPSLPGQWVQMHVRTEDRPAPDIGDAGWDLGLDVPLHTALAAAGALSGQYGIRPLGQLSAANRYSVRAFSRIVVGARDTEARAEAFVSRQLPAASAATYHPARFIELTGGEASAFLREARDHALTIGSAALSYSHPAPEQFAEPPRLSLGQNIVLVFRFLWVALASLVGATLRQPKTTESAVDVRDLGYNVGAKEKRKRPPLGVPDFDALDARAVSEARASLEARHRELLRNPPMPPAQAWSSLVQLATSINDGGRPPESWNPPTRYERRPVVGGRLIGPTGRDAITSATPELADAPSSSVAAGAARAASTPRRDPLASLSSTSNAVARAQEQITNGNREDKLRLDAQLGDLDVPDGSGPSTFLDLVGAQIIGGALRARLDAERWTDFAVTPTESTRDEWPAAQQQFRKKIFIVIGAAAAAAVIWSLVRFVFTDLMPGSTLTAVGYGVIGAAFLIASGIYSNRLFNEYSAILERGRRRLEIRAAWARRAEVALFEAARLRAAQKIYVLWSNIFAHVFPILETIVEIPVRCLPKRPPNSTAIGLYSPDDRTQAKLLADAGAQPGWRLRALESIASGATGGSPTDAMKALTADSGIGGGTLIDLRDRCPELWAAYARQLRGELSAHVAQRMTDSDGKRVAVLAPSTQSPAHRDFHAFLDEPWPPPDSGLEEETVEFKIKSTRSSGADVEFSADALAAAVRVQVRDVGPPPQGEPLAADDDDGGDY